MSLSFRMDVSGALKTASALKTKNRSLWANSITSALRETGEALEEAGRADMRRAGNFISARWQQGLHVTVTPLSGAITNPRLTVTHDVKFARIFEYGGIIRGKPLLWIPMGYTGLTMGAAEYGKRYGLFRVDRKRDGLPLLLGIRDGRVKYFGKTQVTIPRKFHLRDLTDKATRQFVTLLRRKLKEGRQ